MMIRGRVAARGTRLDDRDRRRLETSMEGLAGAAFDGESAVAMSQLSNEEIKKRRPHVSSPAAFRLEVAVDALRLACARMRTAGELMAAALGVDDD